MAKKQNDPSKEVKGNNGDSLQQIPTQSDIISNAMEQGNFEPPKPASLDMAKVYDLAPQMLRDALNLSDNQQHKLLTAYAFIVGCGSVLYNTYIKGYDYTNYELYPTLYLAISAPPASGKGFLNVIQSLFNKVHEKINHDSHDAYEQWKQTRTDNPDAVPPRIKTLFLSANVTQSGLIKLLEENGGYGWMVANELDTLINSAKSPYGSINDVIRSNFAHEIVSIARSTDNQVTTIQCPRFSITATGTPNQFANFFTKENIENGLYSRFMILNLSRADEWNNKGLTDGKSKFNHKHQDLQDAIYRLWKRFEKYKENGGSFSMLNVRDDFNAKYRDMYQTYKDTDYASGCVGRLAMQEIRLAQVLTAMRLVDAKAGSITNNIEIDAQSYELASMLVDFASLPTLDYVTDNKEKAIISENFIGKEAFDKLPDEFLSNEINCPIATRIRWVKKWLELDKIRKIEHGKYRKNK